MALQFWRSSGLDFTSSRGGESSIPGQWARIPHTSWPKDQNIEQKQYYSKFDKDFKNGPHQKKKKSWKRIEYMYTICLTFSWNSMYHNIQYTPGLTEFQWKVSFSRLVSISMQFPFPWESHREKTQMGNKSDWEMASISHHHPLP